LISVIRIKKVIAAGTTLKIPLIISIAGFIFWFIEAPDPRFGFGFIIPFQAILLLILFSNQTIPSRYKSWLTYGIALFTLSIFLYLVYRTTKYFRLENLVKPAGVLNVPYKSVNCSSIEINIPLDNKNCGNTPLPCAYNPCDDFMLRGNKITDGFKQANK
jgi:hypothetical protein